MKIKMQVKIKVKLPIKMKLILQTKTQIKLQKIKSDCKKLLSYLKKIFHNNQNKKAVCIYWNFHSNKYIQFFNLAKFHPVWVDAALSFPKASEIYARFLGGFFYIGLVLRVFVNQADSTAVVGLPGCWGKGGFYVCQFLRQVVSVY